MMQNAYVMHREAGTCPYLDDHNCAAISAGRKISNSDAMYGCETAMFWNCSLYKSNVQDSFGI